MSHVYCPECGFQNPEAANYCSKCGALLHTQESAEQTQTFSPEEGEEMLVGQGMVREDWSMVLVFDEVLPALREDGFTDEHFQTIFVDNPRRWIGG